MMVCPLAFSKSAQMIHVINATSDHDSLILVLKKERQIAAFSVFGVCVCVCEEQADLCFCVYA